MIAAIEQVGKGYIARYERQIGHPIEHVWAMLVDNDELEKGFQELRIGELRKGGFMKFDMQDGKFEQLEIYEYTLHSVLEFDWFGDVVRFELHPEQKGCLLIFQETFTTINEQRIKDLAGWHVCLDVIKLLLDGKPIESRKDDWKKWHNNYKQAINELVIADKE